MQYDAVLFDFDGVVVENPSSQRLYDALGRTYEKFGRSGPASETFQELMRGDFESLAQRCHSLGIKTDSFCAQAAREMVRVQREEVERGLRSAYDDVAAMRSLEAPLGIVSDNHPTVVSTLLDRFGLRSLFETVYGCPLTPDGLSRRKPDPTNIEAAIADLEAETALYVGDRAVDIRAADNAGIDSALISRPEADEPDLDATPTYQLSSLSQLPAALR
ncbi:HAD family hydrolase [Natrinema hispanicum]|uniref:Phosphoglycolate phosphatase n=1 Tax=Natrinema hispanicum TaxID=392421 RepID=A0A1G6PXW5_9EURY|nr:HAD family hydrolase [Natrinema hispanicum]SDC84215.1 phosphoglycolate phosphatase [Natrinema hispanicum]SET33065.1 phosphoglycolate phosphatase [Natrinema hispanicum]